MRVDWAALKAKHRLVDVARRTGIDLPAAAGTVRVRCVMGDHEDRTPSMDLHLDEDRYYCHGCKAHGDVIQWVADIYRVSKRDAVTMLERPGPFGPPPGGMPSIDHHHSGTQRPAAERPDPDRTPPGRVLAAVSEAWRYYTYGALHDAAVGYLRERGIDVTDLETAGPVVGRTPFRGEARLVEHLHRRGFSDDELVDAGLAVRRAGQHEMIDFFRQRIILPVRDPDGRVVGLIGRYDDTVRDLPPGGVKYLNTARTAVYDKASPAGLYRPTLTPLDADGQVVVCEGTIDALAVAAAAARAGLTSKYAPVAESGTAISPTQWQTILALNDRPPVLCADGDPTGRAACVRWAADAALAGRETCITFWPDGHDPASWLAEHGPSGLTAVTRRGCLHPADGELRPVPAAGLVAAHLIETGRVKDALAHVERVVDRARRIADAQGYAPTVATAAVAVAARLDGHTGRAGRIEGIIDRVATWGTHLDGPARAVYCETAGRGLARAGLGPDGWLVRKITATVEATVPTGNDHSLPNGVPLGHSWAVQL